VKVSNLFIFEAPFNKNIDMHYLQNSWFVTNWLWVLCVLAIAVAVIAYINNRKILLKRSMVTICLMFILSVSGTLAFTGNYSNNSRVILPVENDGTQLSEQESTSMVQSVFSYIFNIAKERVSE
jgi:cell division protein FtsW (lipid II flippase)